MWKIKWKCWCGEIRAQAHENGFGVNDPVIEIVDDFGTSVVLDTAANRRVLEIASRLELAKIELAWSGKLSATVTSYETVQL